MNDGPGRDAPAVGIIGVGSVGAGTQRGDRLARILPSAGARVTAFCDVVEENARRAAGAAPGARAFTDLDAFLESGIDAAVICTPVGCHVPHAVRCLDRGIHVLSEVPAAATLDDARRLVEAAGRSSGRYMLAENYRYYDEVELLKRMVEDGRFGDVYYAEGAYILDWKGLWRNPDGSLTWRGKGFVPVYCTHSLGPILYWLDDRIGSVSCLANAASLYQPEAHWLGNHTMLMRTEKERTVLVRVDHLSSRPWDTWFELQGNRGNCRIDHLLRCDHESKVWLADEHERGTRGRLWDYAERYIADRLGERGPIGQPGRRGRRDDREYRMLKDFVRSVETGAPSPIDVHAAMDYSLPGIVAAESAEQGGTVLTVPDSRDWLQ